VSKPSLAVVLAEDERHQRLLRKYLYRLGYQLRDIRFRPLPGGRGCGEQWVREGYAAEVKNYRARSARAKTALIVAIDADTGGVDRRLRQLREALEHSGVDARADDEVIVHLIPKRNVETWILCLSGRQVDEITDYKHENDVDKLIPAAAATLFEWSRMNATPTARCVPSLSAAIFEARRLE
jgi:hypothetical protein